MWMGMQSLEEPTLVDMGMPDDFGTPGLGTDVGEPQGFGEGGIGGDASSVPRRTGRLEGCRSHPCRMAKGRWAGCRI